RWRREAAWLYDAVMRTDRSPHFTRARELVDQVHAQLKQGGIDAATQSQMKAAVRALSPKEANEIAFELDVGARRSGIEPEAWSGVAWTSLQERASAGSGLGFETRDQGPVRLAALERPRSLGLFTGEDLHAAVDEGTALIARSERPTQTLTALLAEFA